MQNTQVAFSLFQEGRYDLNDSCTFACDALAWRLLNDHAADVHVKKMFGTKSHRQCADSEHLVPFTYDSYFSS